MRPIHFFMIGSVICLLGLIISSINRLWWPAAGFIAGIGIHVAASVYCLADG